MPECFFSRLGGCEGRLVKAHLIPKQRIKRELRFQASFRPEVRSSAVERWLTERVWDPRAWTHMCGGHGYGNAGHHGQFDNRQIRIFYDELPEGVKEFAREYGLEWSLERDYAR